MYYFIFNTILFIFNSIQYRNGNVILWGRASPKGLCEGQTCLNCWQSERGASSWGSAQLAMDPVPMGPASTSHPIG